MAPDSIPLDDPSEIYPGLEVVRQRRNLHANQYMPTNPQFAQSLMVPMPIGIGK